MHVNISCVKLQYNLQQAYTGWSKKVTPLSTNLNIVSYKFQTPDIYTVSAALTFTV